MNLEGMTLSEATRHILNAAKSSPQAEPLLAIEEEDDSFTASGRRYLHFCDICERHIDFCTCEDGPY